jgi:hypothetical protein
MEYIIIYQNCGAKRTSFKITMTNSSDYWDMNKLLFNQVTPETISEIFIGPKTAVEIFEDGFFNSSSYKIANSSQSEGKVYTVGCPNGRMWRPRVRSLIIWTYDRYNELFGIQYCNSDLDCGEFDKCICMNGQAHPSWCPISKKRCMNRGYYVNDQPVPINSWDNVNLTCFDNLLNNVKKTNNNTVYSDGFIKDIARRCNTQLSKIECFDEGRAMQPMGRPSAAICIIIIIIIYYLISNWT